MPGPFRDTLEALKARAARLEITIARGRKQVAALEEAMRIKRRSERALLHDPARRPTASTAVIVAVVVAVLGIAIGLTLTGYLFVRGCASH